MGFRVILAIAAFALAGCNANHAINPSGQADHCANDTGCNPYNPSSYAQNNTGNCAMTITPACPSRH
jgi:hypothetical protein